MGPQALFGPRVSKLQPVGQILPSCITVFKALLEPSHAPSFRYYLWLTNYGKGHGTHKDCGIYYLVLYGKKSAGSGLEGAPGIH